MLNPEAPQLRHRYVTDQKIPFDEYDSSIGNNEGFLVRRARIVISGDTYERVSLYLQTDFWQSAGTASNN
jgi:hypothetical protein